MHAKITLLGAGAVGLICAASLASRGVAVDVLARGRHATAVSERGIEIREQDGRVWRASVSVATDDITLLAAQETDLVIFAAKAFDTEALIDQWISSGGSTHRAVSFQNTVRNEALLTAAFKEAAGAVVRIGGDVVGPGTVGARYGRRVQLGPVVTEDGKWIEGLARQLETAGIGASLTDAIMDAKFYKLVLNCDSALSAASDLGINQLTSPAAVAIRRQVREEAVAVAQAEGVQLAALPGIEVEDIPPTPTGYSSTWHDLRQERGRTETPWLNGHIVERGRAHGIPTPANRVLERLVVQMAAEHTMPGAHSPEEITELIRQESE